MKCYHLTSLLDNGIVKWKEPAVTDNSGNVSFTCDAHSGTKLSIGRKIINCEAVDGSGNRANCSYTLTVYGKVVCSIKPQTLVS